MPSLTSIVASSSLSFSAEPDGAAHLEDAAAAQKAARRSHDLRLPLRERLFAIVMSVVASAVLLGGTAAMMTTARGTAVALAKAKAEQSGTEVALLGDHHRVRRP